MIFILCTSQINFSEIDWIDYKIRYFGKKEIFNVSESSHLTRIYRHTNNNIKVRTS